MAVINTTGITNGGTIQAEHITRAIDALSGVGTDTIIATGSFSGSFSGTVTSASFATSSSLSVSASLSQTASVISVTDTTSGTGPYYVIFTDGTTGTRDLRVDSTTNALAFNATSNTLTTTASYAIRAAIGPEQQTLQVSSGPLYGFTSGSLIYVGTGVTGSTLGSLGVALPYACKILSASVTLNTPTVMNAAFNQCGIYHDTTLVKAIKSLDPKTVAFDSDHVSCNTFNGTANKLLTFRFASTATITGLTSVVATFLIEKT